MEKSISLLVGDSIYYLMMSSRVSKAGIKLDEAVILKIQILAANRIPYKIIHELTGVSAGTISKYCATVKKLPQKMCKNPFDLISEDQLKTIERSMARTAENLELAKALGDIDYLIEQHEEGTRFTGPLDQISLPDLQKLMDVPTGYHSKLPVKRWAAHYLGGKEGAFLRWHPHQWCKLQNEMFDLWQEHKMLMIECFRDGGKTMVADAILPHEICENVDNNYFIMSETKEKAGDRVKQIGDVLLTNKKIIADYGFLPHISRYGGTKQYWRGNKITVKRHFKQTDPTLMAFSTESPAATGAHFAGGVFDDVWSFNLEQNSLRNKEKFFGWFYGELEGCLEDAWELWLLTRKGVHDLYRDLEDSQNYVVFKKPAIIKYPSKWEARYKNVAGKKVLDYIKIYKKDGKITEDCHGRFSMEFFLKKKIKMPADKFEGEYQLNPMASSGVYWKYKDLRWINNGHTGFMKDLRNRNALKLLRIAGFMDMAFGTKSRADYTALAIVALFDRKFYFLELYLKHAASENDMVDMMKEACKTFPMLRNIYIEADFHQTNWVEKLKKKARFVSIKPFLSRQESARLAKEDSAKRADLQKKPLRIWSQLEGLIEDNILYINRYLRNLKEFKDEFNTFPMCQHFDVLDALGNACSVLGKKAVLIYALSG